MEEKYEKNIVDVIPIPEPVLHGPNGGCVQDGPGTWAFLL